LVEPDRVSLVLGVPQSYRAGHQGEPEMASPDWTRWHHTAA
jgi:hypothetical protein